MLDDRYNVKLAVLDQDKLFDDYVLFSSLWLRTFHEKALTSDTSTNFIGLIQF